MSRPNYKNANYFELFAKKLVELRLSEFGYRFIPNLYPLFRKITQAITAKAKIIKSPLKEN